MPASTSLLIDSGTGPRRVRLADYLSADGEESAAVLANAWIKALRHARVDGRTFRERFTYRGDTLWWFAELFLHKERAVLSLYRTILAFEALAERERPVLVRLVRGSPAARTIGSQFCNARQIRYEGPRSLGSPALGPVAMEARSAALAVAAMASPRRPRSDRRVTAERARVAAFVHTAFWREDGDEGSAESYIGPVLHALEKRLPREAIAYVGVGPATNFRARRWWRPARAAGGDVVTPIERFAPRSAMQGSWQLWQSRNEIRRALHDSQELRNAAVIRGCDCWPIVRDALDGVALLQFPWSARAMDEAGAALDALTPTVVVTYAEAGGWGRALALESRRRGIPLVGLQHGFIYRHWLNYRHEPDEMAPASDGSADLGFPRPALTLLFDEYAAQHLVTAGRFPRQSLAVTGSPRLEALVAAASSLTPDRIAATHGAAGAAHAAALVLVVSKFNEIRPWLPDLVNAARQMPAVHLAIKTHPAETPALYEPATKGAANISVLSAATDLAPLVKAARAIVTVNSTVALDALLLGTPAVVIGLPTNLSPFVSRGVMAGVAAGDEIAPVLRNTVYDEEFRLQLAAAGSAFAAEYRLAPAGAADRSAEAILAVATPFARADGGQR